MSSSKITMNLALLNLLVSFSSAARLADLHQDAKADLITGLPGLTDQINFRQYSGYLKADDQQETNKFFHYWFAESQRDPKSDPVVLWLNGGPGCSSLAGFFDELGPFKINGDSRSLRMNPYSWNKIANVIFISSPAGVGFSYAKDGNTDTNDDDTAKSNHLALRDFFRKFPQFKRNDLYLTGESYAGVYLPTLGVLVDEDKDMNLAGIAIGNGYLDAKKLGESLIFFSYYHGLYGKDLWRRLSAHCCDGKPPARGACNFSTVSAECSDAISDATDVILNSGLNPYNLYAKCSKATTKYNLTVGESSSPSINSRERIDRQLVLHSLNMRYDNGHDSLRGNSSKLLELHSVKESPPCVDESPTVSYVNQESVRKAIHIPDSIQQWDICTPLNYVSKYPASPDGLAPQVRKLIASQRKLRMLVYNGDIDMMCNFIGDEWFVDDLGQKVLHQYQPWFVDGQVAGYVKHYQGISYMTIKGSGHMVPEDKPKEAYNFFDKFIDKRHQWPSQ